MTREQIREQYGVLRDIVGGLLQWQVWTRLGWQEVKRRYRRTVFGPFWATFSMRVGKASLRTRAKVSTAERNRR